MIAETVAFYSCAMGSFYLLISHKHQLVMRWSQNLWAIHHRTSFYHTIKRETLINFQKVMAAIGSLPRGNVSEVLRNAPKRHPIYSGISNASVVSMKISTSFGTLMMTKKIVEGMRVANLAHFWQYTQGFKHKALPCFLVVVVASLTINASRKRTARSYYLQGMDLIIVWPILLAPSLNSISPSGRDLVENGRTDDQNPRNINNGTQIAFKASNERIKPFPWRINEVITMTLKHLIKQAIVDKSLRSKLLSEPVQTCKEYAVKADHNAFERFEMHPFKDLAIIQGGYRP